jgi:uncharacterized protein YkwD
MPRETGASFIGTESGMQFLRRGISIALIATTAALAACQSSTFTGVSEGQNRNGAAYLAGIRAANGLPTLVADAGLEEAARQQAQFMAGAGEMSHTTGFRRAFASRMHRNGVDGAAAENIAHGAFGMDELFQRWLNSPPHRKNMLNPDYSRFGLASAQDSGGSKRYWALVLAK